MGLAITISAGKLIDRVSLYLRKDSKYWWMLLERPGQKPLLESTRVLHLSDQPAVIRRQQRQEAEEIYRARMTELARARHDLPSRTPKTISFAKYADWFEKHHIPKRRGAERERELLVPLRAFFGTRDLSTIDRTLVQEYMTARLAERIGPEPPDGEPDTRPPKVRASTVNREVDLLKSMLREAVPKYLRASPLVGMKRLRTVPIKKRVLTPEEETRLLTHLAPADRGLYIVAVDTLMRLSNVLNLTRAEDKGTHLELIDSKTGPYDVPLSDRARAALDAIPDDGPYYFAHRRVAKTERDRRGSVRQMLERACELAGIPYGRATAGITFHTGTRATGATRMLRAGVDPKTVQTVGNWKSLEQMGAYLQTDRELMRAAVNRIAPAEPITSALRHSRTPRKHRIKSGPSKA